MPTKARRRRMADAQRIGEAVSYPGIDPRTWVSSARVDDATDGFRFEPALGWIADVNFYGSGLDQETEVPSRWMSIGPAGNGYGEYLPPLPGCEVIVVLPAGDPDADPIVVGNLTNEADCKPPTVINELPINAELQVSTTAAVSPYDTELKKSQHNRREQYEKDYTLQARTVVARADEVLRLQVESGARIEIVATGDAPIQILQQGTGPILVDGPDIRIADGARPLMRVGDISAGGTPALVAVPLAGGPPTHAVIPLLPALPTSTGGIPITVKGLTGQNRAKA